MTNRIEPPCLDDIAAQLARTPPPEETFGQRLRLLRENAGLSEGAVASVLGLDREGYAAVERDAAPAPLAKLPALAEALDGPLTRLVAALYAAPEHISELHTLAEAFNAIPCESQREALLGMALVLGDGR